MLKRDACLPGHVYVLEWSWRRVYLDTNARPDGILAVDPTALLCARPGCERCGAVRTVLASLTSATPAEVVLEK